MNRIANRLSMQSVKVKTELVHLVDVRGRVEFSQAPQNPACILASIFDVLPSRQSSSSALFLNVLITTRVVYGNAVL
jgi:hypothetical protein